MPGSCGFVGRCKPQPAAGQDLLQRCLALLLRHRERLAAARGGVCLEEPSWHTSQTGPAAGTARCSSSGLHGLACSPPIPSPLPAPLLCEELAFLSSASLPAEKTGGQGGPTQISAAARSFPSASTLQTRLLQPESRLPLG